VVIKKALKNTELDKINEHADIKPDRIKRLGD